MVWTTKKAAPGIECFLLYAVNFLSLVFGLSKEETERSTSTRYQKKAAAFRPVNGTVPALQTGHGTIIECDVVAPVESRFKNRRSIQSAMVLPGDSEPLLGARPLEDMDVLIHSQRQELIVNPDPLILPG